MIMIIEERALLLLFERKYTSAVSTVAIGALIVVMFNLFFGSDEKADLS